MFYPAETGGEEGQTLYDVIVAGDGSGDYTSIATAFNTEGSAKSYFIKAGIYYETVNVIPPANSYIVYGSENGGVVIDNSGGGTFTTNSDTPFSSQISTIGNNLVTFGGAPNLAVVAATPSNYKYWHKGQSYGIVSVNNTTKVLTLDRNVINPDGGAANYSMIVYLPVAGVVMAGKLTLQNTADHYPLTGFESGDWSRLNLTANKQITISACGMDIGTMRVINNTYTSARRNGIYFPGPSSGVTGKLVVKGCSGSVAGQTYSVLWLSCEDMVMELDVTGNINTDGGNSNFGLAANGTRGSSAWGVCINNETEITATASVNIVGLRVTV